MRWTSALGKPARRDDEPVQLVDALVDALLRPKPRSKSEWEIGPASPEEVATLIEIEIADYEFERAVAVDPELSDDGEEA